MLERDGMLDDADQMLLETLHMSRFSSAPPQCKLAVFCGNQCSSRIKKSKKVIIPPEFFKLYLSFKGYDLGTSCGVSYAARTLVWNRFK